MASEPLDGNESRNLIERHRFGDVTKVYSRRIFRARRNNNSNNSSTAATSIPAAGIVAAVSNGNDVDKGDRNSDTFNRNDSEKSSPTLAAEDGISLQQDQQLGQKGAAEVVVEEDIEQEEGGCRNGIVGPDSMEVPPESREAVPPESTEGVSPESTEAVMPPECRDAVMPPESRDAVETVVERESRETMPESRDAVEAVVEPESREAMPESREAVEPLEGREMAVEPPEGRDMAVEPPEGRDMAVEPPESRDMAVELRESRDMAVELPENRDMAVELPENRDMEVELPESRDVEVELQESRDVAVELPESSDVDVELPESRDVDVELPESREVDVEPESRDKGVELSESRDLAVELPESRDVAVEPESRDVAVEPESRDVAVEMESREMDVEPESREVDVEPESRDLDVEPESRDKGVELSESRDLAVELPESRDVAVEPESRDVAVEPESRDVAVETESREMDVEPESREMDVMPQENGNGAAEANGAVRPQQQQEPQLVEVQPWPPVVTRVEDRVRINVSGVRSRDEIMELRRELETELDQVRSLFKKLEAKELQLTAYNRSILIRNSNSSVGMVNGNNNGVIRSFGGGGSLGGYSQPQYVANDFVERRALMRVNSEMGSVGHQETRPFSRSLSVSVVENNHGVGEFVEREKRTPKANQFYRNSEFLLGKDRLPPESNKKFKPNGAGRKHGGEGEHGFGFGYDKQQRERMFRSCSSLLQRLMKHKFGWVFNVPVDAKKLGLHDYHDIIKHPMDLGTIKTRLSQNYYKFPKEFAEDVRLVFHNAMTYNPKGQDVHVMAETLLQIFEERWAVIQTEYNPDWRFQMYHDAGLPTPTSRKAPPAQFYTPARAPAPAPITIPVTPAPQMRSLDRLELMTTPVDPKLKPSNFTHVGRTPVLKKPKAKDPNKRDMTYEEKQKLSTNLQSLPSEKLDAIVQIIKKRNSTLNQHDDEIEVDIDSVDAETLWELDRFVTNYKKNLSKNKRKAEIALQARAVVAPTIPVMNTAPAVADAQKESRIGENNAPPVQVEKQGDNVSRSSSSSSSSSDSGSSSSDSDSDSSSAYGSDAGRSPRT